MSIDAQARRAPARPVGPPPATVSPNAVLTVIALGGLAVIGLWWQDTRFVYGLGSEITNAGRITGLLAGWTVLVVLGLMARVPAVERGVGADRLARWHASCGRYLVFLALAHTVLVVWGYAVVAKVDVWAETKQVVLHRPWVLSATIGLALFLVVGAVSARAARRRISYEAWHLVHLTTYVAIALAFMHAILNGAQFIHGPMRAFWTAAYLAVAGLLIWYRVVTPLLAARRHQFRVVRVEKAGRGVVSVYVTGRDLPQLNAEAGQFFRWRFLVPGMWWAANPYSLSAAPAPGQLRITVKSVGGHSAALARLRPGTRVIAEGPYGAFTAQRQERRKVLLIGVGVGITPLRALLESIPGDVTLMYRARSSRDLVLRGEIEAIASARNAPVHYLLGSRHSNHLSAANLRRLVPDVAERDVFFCGPDDLAADLRKALRHAGVPARHIHHESFAF